MKQDNNRLCPGNRHVPVVIQARMMPQWAVKSSVKGSYLCSEPATAKGIISSAESLRITDTASSAERLKTEDEWTSL